MNLTLEQAIARYGVIRNGVWENEAKWCRILSIPDEIGKNWINTANGLPTSHIYCNRDFAPVLMACLENVLHAGLAHELKSFDGCYRIRDIRGVPGKLSTHAYALAIDISAHENEMGHPTSFSPKFVECFTKEGLVWGELFKRCDPMHFQMASW